MSEIPLPQDITASGSQDASSPPDFSFSQTRLLWLYLVLISIAEFLTAAISAYAGLFLHAMIMVLLIYNGAKRPSEVERYLTLALILGPMTRLLSLSLPLRDVPVLGWFPSVSTPLLLATYIASRQAGMTRRMVGLRLGKPFTQLLLAGMGFGLGTAEYFILHPEPLIETLRWQSLLLPVLTLIIFTGFAEEFIFRGVLQALALPVLGRATLIYISLLFAALHIGYLSVLDIIFVFAVGWLFAYIVEWTGSIAGVTLAHGLTNIMLFLIWPLTIQRPALLSSTTLSVIVAIGSVCGVLGIIMAATSSRRKRREIEYSHGGVLISGSALDQPQV